MSTVSSGMTEGHEKGEYERELEQQRRRHFLPELALGFLEWSEKKICEMPDITTITSLARENDFEAARRRGRRRRKGRERLIDWQRFKTLILSKIISCLRSVSRYGARQGVERS